MDALHARAAAASTFYTAKTEILAAAGLEDVRKEVEFELKVCPACPAVLHVLDLLPGCTPHPAAQ